MGFAKTGGRDLFAGKAFTPDKLKTLLENIHTLYMGDTSYGEVNDFSLFGDPMPELLILLKSEVSVFLS